MAKLGPEDFRKRLAKALRIGGDAYSPEDIMRAVDAGRMQAWTRNDSLVVTEVLNYPRASAVNIVLAVGDLNDVMALQPEIEAFGRAHGARMLRMEGRKGWSSVLPSFGWKQDNKVIYERTL